MIKKNKLKLILSSIITLLPMLLVFAGKLLPEKIAVHWGVGGSANGFMNASAFFLILPPILLAVHWGCMLLTVWIAKNLEQNKKVMEITFWTIPGISVLACGTVLATALGYSANILAFVWIVLAAIFIYIGNYMPKTTRNVALGMKVRWTLANDENWNATHRFAGKVFVVAGVLCLAAILLPYKLFPFAALALILLTAVLPVLYSYFFYRKQLANGTATKEDYANGYGELVKNKKLATILTVCMIVVLAIVLPIVMFAGRVEATAGADALVVKASFWEDLHLRYEDVDAVEYREEGVDGERVGGFGSAKLLLGNFRNDEFGTYARYTYTGDLPCIVLTVDANTIVLGMNDAKETRELYEALVEKLQK